MTYKLKGNLSKTAVFCLVNQFNTSLVSLPSIRRCFFRKHRGTYWLNFSDSFDYYYETCVSVFCGFVHNER